MSDLSEPDHMTDMAVELGIERGHWGAGKASFSLQVSQRHCNKAGVAHGGLYTLMLDMALGGSLVCTLKKEEWCATTQLNVSFINAARPDEKIIAEGNLEKRGKHVAHLSGKITTQSGRLIATATGVWAIWNHKPASQS